MFIPSFSISYVCLAVDLLILCAISVWDSATAHSPCSKELNPSSQEDARFSGRIVLLIFSHYPAQALFGLVLNHITH